MKKILYDEEEDILNIEFGKDKYRKSPELSNGIIIDISENGDITAIEIM